MYFFFLKREVLHNLHFLAAVDDVQWAGLVYGMGGLPSHLSVEDSDLLIFRAVFFRESEQCSRFVVRSSVEETIDFIFFLPDLCRCGAHAARAVPPWVRLPGLGVNRPHLCKTEVKNEWCYTSTPSCACMAWRLFVIELFIPDVVKEGTAFSLRSPRKMGSAFILRSPRQMGSSTVEDRAFFANVGIQ